MAKRIFSVPEITKHFISDMLDIKIKEVEILDGLQVHQPREEGLNFYTAVDVLAQLEDETQVIIEIQVAKQNAFIKRLWAYIGNQISKNMEKQRIENEVATHHVFEYLVPVYTIAM